jgi:adenine phosphoribosyltransferase
MHQHNRRPPEGGFFVPAGALNKRFSNMDKQALELELKQVIKTVVDYPKPGIVFRDVTSLMQDGPSFKKVIDAFCYFYADKGITKIVGTESRGFIFGAPLAYAMGISFVPVRKPGKLPRQRISQSYQLEYGEDALELHADAIAAGDKVLLVDDLLATGGTIDATAKLVRQLGGIVDDAAFVIALPELGGVKRLQQAGLNILSLVEYSGE